MQTFDYLPTTRVVFEENALDQLGSLAAEIDCKRALLVTDAGLLAAGHVQRAAELLSRRQVVTEIFSGVEENPTTKHVTMGLNVANQFRPDILVALGGGSSMDCAKGINFLYTNGGKMEDYCGMGKAGKAMLPSIGIPTTAGTGSEAQSFAVISQETSHRKMACGDLKARFRVAILDPALLKSVPRQVKMVTGIDAMSHAIESYVCTAGTPISRMFAKEAWRRLDGNYDKALSESASLEARSNMLLGAHLAGMAIENSMLGATHACANPLTANHGLTHGIAVGIMLPHVVRFNAEDSPRRYDGIFDTGGSEARGGGSSADELATRLTQRLRTNKWPEKLRELHIPEDKLPELAREAAEQWTARFNPQPVGEKELLGLFRQAY